MNIIIDLVLIGIITLCAWNGYRKGLILGISGIIALIIAFFGANLVAETYSGEFTAMLEPFISGLVDSSVDKAREEFESGPDTGADPVYEVSFESLKSLGFLKSAADTIAAQIKEEVSEVGHTLKESMVRKLCSTISYAGLLIIVFILIVIIITVIANIINLAFKLPGLEIINDIGGAVFGLAKGLIFAFALAWALRFFGLLIPESTVDRTLILGWLMDNNPITAIFGI